MQNTRQPFGQKSNQVGTQVHQAPASSMMTTASSARCSRIEDVMAFIYDIPKSPLFTNKTLTAYFQENGWKNTHVQIIKDSKNDENAKPFWSARVKFHT